jgi:hypothetical protein
LYPDAVLVDDDDKDNDKDSVSPGFVKQITPLSHLYYITCNISLISWMVARLIDAKLKPLIFAHVFQELICE